MAKISPMLQQYNEIKQQYKKEILFFQVGDFYEMFFEDAVLASKEADLTLTSKDMGLEERAPMCGVPQHSCEAYVQRLIERGCNVAICDQVEDPATAKGLVRREVTRVITPGTIIENSMLQDDRNNYLASIYISGRAAGLCFADISTGTAQIAYVEEDIEQSVNENLGRFMPSEVLLSESVLEYKGITDFIRHQLNCDHHQCSVEVLAEEEFSAEKAMEKVREQFGGAFDESSGLAFDTLGFLAMGALIGYLEKTQKRGIERLKTIEQYDEKQYMNLPPTTRANLELTEAYRRREKKGSLLWVLDDTGTAMGKRMLRNWVQQPLCDANAINRRLDAVDELYKSTVERIDIREMLKGIFDIERVMTRLIYGSVTPREVSALAATCALLPPILEKMAGFKSEELRAICNGIDPLTDVCERITGTLGDDPPASLKLGGVIREGFDQEIDDLRNIVNHGKDILVDLETKLKEETGIRTLKVRHNKVFGYFIEVSKSFIDQVPENFIRKQTLTGGERYITEELKSLESRIMGANDRLTVLERDLFAALTEEIAGHLDRIQGTATFLAQLDVLASLAQVAVVNHYYRPSVNDSDEIVIREGRHPVIEKTLASAVFVPNDTKMDCKEHRMQIITGPNMAGKSTYMRQSALIVIMAQIGSFVPALSCEIGVCDAVFTRVGASDDLSQGRSTFMVEMTEVAEILQNATPKSLVILDEIGRGTSTFDGMSIAQGVLEYLTDKSVGPACKTMFATHYHELTDLESCVEGVKNYNIAVKKRGDNITFLRRIVRGPADDSYGIQVAKLAGVPEWVLARSKQILKALEATSTRNNVSQLDFDALDTLQNVQAPSELLEKLREVDPETLTPLEALNLVFELKQNL